MMMSLITQSGLGSRLLILPVLSLSLLQPALSSDRPAPSAETAATPNILVVVLDDVGVDLVAAYGSGSGQTACTPSLNFLAERGLMFSNVWADPLCSPTRAQMLTGRHGFRTGVGTFVNGNSSEHFEGLPAAETTIAEMLSDVGYSTALFGKWHLATGNVDPADPLRHGFERFEGSIPGTLDPEKLCPTCPPGCQSGGLGYDRWVKSLNGLESCDTRYATTANVDDALVSVGGDALPEPWFVVTSFNAIHSPFHIPPESLCLGKPNCACEGPMASATAKALAALEAADRELRRLVVTLRDSNELPIWLFLVGDNGTPRPVANGNPGGCFDPQRSKGTVYQGGVHVPLMVWSPGIEAGRIDSLVAATDLFATIAELAGVAVEAEDSVSLVPYLEGFTGSLRSTIYAERFEPNGLPFAPDLHDRAIRDGRFKLIRRQQDPDELFDLEIDPCESQDLFPPPAGSAAESAWQQLDAELTEMGVG